MATLGSLKRALVQGANTTTSIPSPRDPLANEQYAAGFEAFVQGPGWTTYRDFIIPELAYLLAPLYGGDASISVLEIGPGPRSVLGYLPESLRSKIGKYTAFEPNTLFASKLEEWLEIGKETDAETKSPFVGLGTDPIIHHTSFDLKDNETNGSNIEKYDFVLFCHSMYGMKPQRRFIERALKMLVDGGVVAVFHRDGSLHIDGLACHHTASYPTGAVGVVDNDDALDSFTSFIAGFTMRDANEEKAVRADWRKLCHSLSRREDAHPKYLLFPAPEVMMTFNHHADAVSELEMCISPVIEKKPVKNKEARLQRPATVVRPVTVENVQSCVQWALKHEMGLTVVGGGHNAHCLKSNVVAIDMSAFGSVHVLTGREKEEGDVAGSSPLAVVGAGCKTDDIISKTLKEGFTVPLGSRPSVGVGLALQGGIGHLTRPYGLTCDNIVGAVMVSVASGEVIHVGCVPSEHLPKGASRPENEADILWALKGAGTSFGVIVSITFKAYSAPTFVTRNWVLPLSDNADAKRRIREFDDIVAKGCDDCCSADAYLYWEDARLNLGITTFEITSSSATPTTTRSKPKGDIWGTESKFETMNGVKAFGAEMYMSAMHGGHGGGKTSSFKRCVFLKGIGGPRIAHRLVAAVESRPSPFCYLHLLHGGGKAGEVTPGATAFGCRDWDFACVITGVWPRDEDGTQVAHASVQWVYTVVESLLPLSNGTYGADLGPDPRDAALAEKAFGPNTARLGRLKRVMDPHNVLAWTCPLPKPPLPKLIVLVTGESGAGKDYCADVWVSIFSKLQGNASSSSHGLRAQAARISDVTKREFAETTGTEFSRLLEDRAYKEKYRPELTAFYMEQVQKRPQLPGEHFMKVVHEAAIADVDVLFITGMRDEAPVASFAHLVPESKLIEVYVEASEASRVARDVIVNKVAVTDLGYCPNLIFENNAPGKQLMQEFAEANILRFIHNDLQRLSDMVRSVSDFPKPGIQFRHVVGISQQPGGLALCASLLQSHFTGSWAKVDAIVCCEVGGLIFAPALASLVGVPLVPIREAGKLPPPTLSVIKDASYISSKAPNHAKIEKHIEVEQSAIIGCGSVVVVDDVLSTGETLCAVLHLLEEAGVEDVRVMVVAEFPLHRGRKLLHDRGFGMVNVQSLLVFGGD
jgi:adenine phosphoribosyltransferase/phosphomevalonate kinase